MRDAVVVVAAAVVAVVLRAISDSEMCPSDFQEASPAARFRVPCSVMDSRL